MEAQSKICQNCQKEFVIEPQDFAFYEKIKVPAPTWCPECRMIRRFFWKNERGLYKRKCNVPGHKEEFISMYSPDKKVRLYDKDFWWSDDWDPLEYGKEYSFTRSFFEQLKELQQEVPRPPLVNNKAVNSDYCNFADENKNCYLISTANRNENSSYGFFLVENKDISDCLFCSESELLYQCIDCQKCYRLYYSQECKNCIESAFLLDCRNCDHCFFCVGLRTKSYYLLNKPYSKEEYGRMKNEIFGSYKNYLEAVKKFKKLKKDFPMRKSNNFIGCSDKVSGDFIFQSKNIKQGFAVYNSEDVFYAQQGINSKDCCDVFSFDRAEFCYESISVGLPTHQCLFTVFCRDSHSLFYCDNCRGSENLFGCVSLRNKQYCILNKQYTKQEYEELVPKIIEHMNKMPYISKIPNHKFQIPNNGQNSNNQNSKTREIVYRYGEFFPPELSPFCYNETIAQEYFPLTKEQALEQGYSWKDPEERNLTIDIKTEDLPDHIKDVKDDIVGKIIECANARNWRGSDPGKISRGQPSGDFSNCTTAFKIISQELEFYRKMNLPLPRLCPNCRHYERLKQRNPLKLWHRKCMCGGKTSEKAYSVPDTVNSRGEASGNVYQNTIEHFHKDKPCSNEFETTYAPDRPEIVYCEECYKREVN